MKQHVNGRQAHTFQFNWNSFFSSTGCDIALSMRTNVISSRPETTLNVLKLFKMKIMAISSRQQLCIFCLRFCYCVSASDDGGWWFPVAWCLPYINIIIHWTFRIFCNSFSSRRDFVTRKWIQHVPMCLNLFRAHQIENWSDFPNWNVRKTVPHRFSLSPVISFFFVCSQNGVRSWLNAAWQNTDR